MLAALATLVALGPAILAQQAAQPARIARAEAVVDALVAREFAKVVAQFDATMKGALSEDALRTGWDDAVSKAGAFVRRSPGQEQTRGAYQAVAIPCEFANGKLDITVVFNAAGEIAGLSMRPPAPAVPYSPPDYAVASAFTERDVTVGTGEWALPGTLTMPVGAGPFPAVVLVHGSGPNDRDESIGPNKIFKDLALGLASRGVAVLRFDKRTFVHAAKLRSVTQLTVKEESIDDAVAAVALLRAEPSINPAKIFVLGHSLGGMIAPRIAAADPRIAGLIVMAGAVRSIPQAMLDQYQYLAKADGTVTPEEQKLIDGAKQLVDAVAKLTAEDAKSSQIISGAPASYWLDLRGFDPPSSAARLPQRILVLQGERDYQVTVSDFVRWESGLAGNPNAQFKLYPDLNHLFIPGTGKSLPAEYSVPGHVLVNVIDDIAKWIKG